MRLADLTPRWFAEPGRHGQGVVFRSPTGRGDLLCVAFSNPLDGGAPFPIRKIGLWSDAMYETGCVERGTPVVPPGTLWTRTGDTFDTLTLSPSVDASPSGNWHGFVRDGAII